MVSREFRRQSRNLPTPSNILPNNIGCPKGWYQGKLGNPRTAANHSIPGKAEKAAKARERFDTGYIDKHISQPGYFSNKNGTELAARGSQLKDYYGLDDPNQEITEDMLP